jgi:NAD(P)-dependent dehydrogenase (short-subunit alcohol dehydrogenase family)
MATTGFSLEGKVAIVTGGSRGIGRAIALGLAEAGADVAIGARKAESLAEAVAAIETIGRRALAVPTNVRDADALRVLVDETKRRLGRVDILVNNAGTNPVFGMMHELEERAWDVVMNTNVRAAWQLSLYAREAMLEHGAGGSIINVGSNTGIRPTPGLGAYAISKAALVMLTKVCAKEWGRDGIRVNCIEPGVIRTEFSRALWDDDTIFAKTVAASALGRIGEAEECAGAVVYLAGPAASFVTGATIVLDGGETL